MKYFILILLFSTFKCISQEKSLIKQNDDNRLYKNVYLPQQSQIIDKVDISLLKRKYDIVMMPSEDRIIFETPEKLRKLTYSIIQK